MFTVTVRDQAYPPRVGNNHFMAQGAEQPADPGRMCAHLNHNSTSGHGAELARQYRLCGADPLLHCGDTCVVQNTHAAESVAEIDSNGNSMYCTTVITSVPRAILLHLPISFLDQLMRVLYPHQGPRPAFSSHLLVSGLTGKRTARPWRAYDSLGLT
jgi:hypothetical protein